MDILRGLPQIGIYLGVDSMQSRVFSLGKRTEWGTFLEVFFCQISKYALSGIMLKFERSQYDRKKGLLKFQMYFGMLEIPDIFGG